jgi:magnesium transporter
MLFMGDSFVVTVRHGEGAPLKVVRKRLEADPDVLRHGPTAVLYSIADATVDHYLEVATELQTDMEGLEAEVFSPEGGDSRNTASRIYTFKRQILEFRRATGPLSLPIARLSGTGQSIGPVPFVNNSARPFFRDVSDHLLRVNESVDALDRISAYAAMAAVPTLIAGIYGMNFDHMPELHWIWSYPIVILGMLCLELLLFRTFKRRGWL